jgi:hypothetical protein
MPSLPRRRAVVTLLAAGALLALALSALAPAHPRPQPTKLADCPATTPDRLPADALAGAVEAALAQAPRVYPSIDRTGMRAWQALLARYGVGPASRAVSITCGRRVKQRTVLVFLVFPAMLPSASLSQGVVAVSRFDGEYRVWSALH